MLVRKLQNDLTSIRNICILLIGLQERGSVTVIAATNRPDKIDPALLRPGKLPPVPALPLFLIRLCACLLSLLM